ncbi:MAG: NOB1 family endonuclease [Methanomicrobiales archaeon]
MIVVLDASVFFMEIPVTGTLYTTPSVVAELTDPAAKGRLERFLASGLVIEEPSSEGLLAVEDAALRTGDAPVLSGADRDLLALAHDRNAAVATDDFAVQNTALSLGLEVVPLRQRRATARRWRVRCTGCGRYGDRSGICPVCGSPMKRKVK